MLLSNYNIKFYIIIIINMEKKAKKSNNKIISILKKKLSKTRYNLISKIKSIIYKKKIDFEIINSLEEKLLVSDIGLDTTNKIINNLKKKLIQEKVNSNIYEQLYKEILDILNKEKEISRTIKYGRPIIILMIGINGVGKTTTAVKLAYKYNLENKKVAIAAGDTFRAAAVEQLQTLSKKYEIPVITKKIGSDAASVVFDAIKKSIKYNFDVLIVDTAGRMQNKVNLINELKKIVGVVNKIGNDFFYEILLVVDTRIGQHNINQVEIFHKSLNIDGIIATKLDDTSKGGILITISDKFDIPIKYICTGQRIEDLQNFQPEIFTNAILSLD